MRTIIIATALAALLATRAGAAPVNLITNGDFSAGNAGFVSDYLYAPDLPQEDDLWDEGLYGISGSAVGRHPYWTTGGDHTGDGAMMLVNGRTDGASTVWRQSVDVEGGYIYAWSAFAKNLCCDFAKIGEQAPASEFTGPSLSFWMNGSFLGMFDTDGPDVWTGHTLWFAADAAQRVDLEIRNAATNYRGNDFAIDGLSLEQLTPTPEPASLLLTGSGLLLIGRRVRRQRARGTHGSDVRAVGGTPSGQSRVG